MLQKYKENCQEQAQDTVTVILAEFVLAHWWEYFLHNQTALFASQLAVMARKSIEQARLRERESWILYEVGRVINSTNQLDEQLKNAEQPGEQVNPTAIVLILWMALLTWQS